MIITFDLGTTFFKACLFDETGRLVALARVVTPTDRPREGQGQITVENFRGAIASLVEELRERAPEAVAEARAVGFATQANTFALLDVDDRPIHPMILWSDRRSASDLDTLVKPVDALNDPSVTGMLEISDGFSPTKVLWLRRHEPEAFARGVRFSTISDELTRWFTGQQVCEAGAAGLTSLLNIHTLTWRTEAIDALDLSHLRWPTPVRAGTDLGEILPEVADSLGLPRKCCYVVGCLDQYAGAIGAGNVRPGMVSETTGTVLATVRLSDRFDPVLREGVYQGPAFARDAYFQMCFSMVSANLLESFRGSEAADEDYEVLNREAEAVRDGVIVMDPAASVKAARPVFVPADAQATRGQKVRAIYQAVADELNRQVRLLCGDDRPVAIRCVGGAARSDVWLRIKADTLGLPMRAIDCPEPTSLGAAICAEAGLSGRSIPDVADEWVRMKPKV